MVGACPPSSIDSFLTPFPDRAANCLPTLVDPVKDTLRMTEDAMRRADISGGSPKTTDSAPGGTPASRNAVATFKAVNGTSSSGLKMQGQPAARAVAILRAGMKAGRFQGAKAATGPTGSLTTTPRPAPAVGITRP